MLLLVLSVLALALRTQEVDARILHRGQTSQFINNGVITTIQTDHGDIYDCVDIHNQPSLSHPLLRNHKLEMRPSFLASHKDEAQSKRKPLPIELKNGGCPKGSVPILRVHKNLSARNSFDKPPNVHIQETSNPSTNQVAFYSTVGGQYYGTRAILGLWAPDVAADQFTEVKITVVDENPEFNSIEVGWAVNPSLFGDTKTRLYSSYTGDSKSQTVCKEASCSGFIQVSQTVAFGAVFSIVSDYGGKQQVIELLLMKDNFAGHWWLTVGPDHLIVGYWPKELFSGLADGAKQVIWGGEASRGAAMGSGHYPEEGFGRAGLIGRMEWANGDNHLEGVDETRLIRILSNEDCYHVLPAYDEVLKPFGMYFGGPGGGNCS